MGCTGSTGTALGCTALQIQGECGWVGGCVCVCGGGGVGVGGTEGGGNDYGWVGGWGCCCTGPLQREWGVQVQSGKQRTIRHGISKLSGYGFSAGRVMYLACMQALLLVLPFVGY